jgi:hypothetical protein
LGVRDEWLKSRTLLPAGLAIAAFPSSRFQSVEELSAAFASVSAKTGVLGRLFGEA